MRTAHPETPANANPQRADADLEPIPLYDRLVLWMFAIGFVGIGLIIIVDLFMGLFR